MLYIALIVALLSPNVYVLPDNSPADPCCNSQPVNDIVSCSPCIVPPSKLNVTDGGVGASRVNSVCSPLLIIVVPVEFLHVPLFGLTVK